MPSMVQLSGSVVRRPVDASDLWQAALDHQRLRRLALGLEPIDVRARAIAALAASDEPSRASLLASILHDHATTMRLRQLAAICLGRIETSSARDVLVDALDVPDEPLVGLVAQSLGRIGDRAAFAAIEKRSATFTGTPLAQARFALRLLAHRLDLHLPDWADDEPVLLPEPGEEAARITFTRAHSIEAQIAARSLAGNSFGIELDELTAQQIRCDDAPQLLFFDRRLASEREGLRSRKRVAGVLGVKSDANGLYLPSSIILTTPDAGGERIRVSLYQPNGTLTLWGSAVQSDRGLAFELRAVKRRGGVAAHIAGTWIGAGISVRTARTGYVRRDVGRLAG